LFLKNKYKKLSDNDLLLELKKSNNRKIIAEIYRRYSHLIFGVCLNFNNNKSNCKDLVSKIFEKFIVFISNKEINSLNSWFYIVTRNECFAENKNKIKFSDLTEYNLSYENKEKNTLNNISDNTVNEAISKLKPEQQICIRLFYLENKSYNQISQETEYDIKKIKSYIQNGKRNLKIIIEKQIEKTKSN